MTQASDRRRFLRAGAMCLGTLALPRAVLAQDPLAHVDPELRPAAAAMLRMAAKPPVPVPAVVLPLPEGVTEQKVSVGAGAPPVSVFVIGAAPTGEPRRGAILHIHGGGFIGGTARTGLRPLQRLAARLDCVIVSVEYRLAPATRFPGSLEDNYAALRWMHQAGPSFGIDPARIVLLGESAGGGHAAMLAIAARDRGEFPIRFQALVYPMLDDRTGSTRPVPPTQGQIVWTAADNRKGWSSLLGQPAGRPTVPANSVPARVASLAGLPPTFIGVGGIDLFVDEDIAFARRLTDAGVATELLVVPGAFHGFELIAPQAAVSRQFKGALEAALSRALTPPKVT